MKELNNEHAIRLNAAIDLAIQHLPATATLGELVTWLCEHQPWIFEHPYLELLADRAIAGLIEDALDALCLPATDADPDVIAYEDRPGHLQYVLRQAATDAEKQASRI